MVARTGDNAVIGSPALPGRGPTAVHKATVARAATPPSGALCLLCFQAEDRLLRISMEIEGSGIGIGTLEE